MREATRLFADRGVAGTSIQAVADAVGVRKPSVLYHFPSKDVLRVAVIDAMLERWKEVIPRALADAAGGKPRFEAIMGAVLDFFEDAPHRARLLVRECLDQPDEMRDRLAHHLRPWMGLVTEAIALGQREGRVHEDLDPEAYLNEIVVLASSHYAMTTVSHAVAPDRSDPQRDRDWERRCRIELVRIAQTSLFRPRPLPA